MKKHRKIYFCITALLLMILLAGCTGSKDEEAHQPSNQASAVQTDEKHTEPEERTKIRKDEAEPTKAANNTSSAEEKSKEDNVLAAYSSEKIEYARVWLQLGPNQEIDELNVRHIAAGEPINSNDDTSASYPENVTQLAGSRLVDGSVTYHGNGDGTIHVYNVPLRWDSADDIEKGVMREVTESIIKNRKTVYVDTGDDEKIKRLIDIMMIH
ncbi:hypothetical protein [Bacillus]|uniref:hypothetical protein n=1 Tax=Bacillus TaxID=1386 RepID=UPI00049B3C7D|nr:hypothetical protein [Bacillus]AIC97114.1 hypothetical protein Q433_02950 [Bacillus subtilis subsp. subtilis str. OH 131.1]ASC84841.1 hypothetical protein CDA59_14180 [Bacillus subtilis]AYK63969.1 hypothetical protein D9C14_10970 [Bacillus subtilis subsp. subtilis]KAA0933372.1 hypothetical protein FQ086_15800 [Bacillus sp. ANT_WA51]MBT2168599.1 hypothetical protein [Bacillus subtilis]